MKPVRGTVVTVTHAYGVEEDILFKYYVNRHWARGISLDSPGRWQHFDMSRARPTERTAASMRHCKVWSMSQPSSRIGSERTSDEER